MDFAWFSSSYLEFSNAFHGSCTHFSALGSHSARILNGGYGTIQGCALPGRSRFGELVADAEEAGYNFDAHAAGLSPNYPVRYPIDIPIMAHLNSPSAAYSPASVSPNPPFQQYVYNFPVSPMVAPAGPARSPVPPTLAATVTVAGHTQQLDTKPKTPNSFMDMAQMNIQPVNKNYIHSFVTIEVRMFIHLKRRFVHTNSYMKLLRHLA